MKTPPAAPVPSPTPEPTPTPKPDQQQSEIGFFVVADHGASFMPWPGAYYDAVIAGCADKLRSGSSARVDATDSSMNRADAIKRAKSETNTYVVWLKLTDDRMGSSTVNVNADELILEYVVFAPGTAKVVTQGRSYQNANRKGPVVVGPTTRRTTGSGIYREELLRIAGEDAAERILKALHLNVPVIH